MFESFFPILLAVIGIAIALIVPLVQSCRNVAAGRAGQAQPINAKNQ
jgi:hypothetical protein